MARPSRAPVAASETTPSPPLFGYNPGLGHTSEALVDGDVAALGRPLIIVTIIVTVISQGGKDEPDSRENGQTGSDSGECQCEYARPCSLDQRSDLVPVGAVILRVSVNPTRRDWKPRTAIGTCSTSTRSGLQRISIFA